MTIFELRKQELSRRVESLPSEVEAWKAATEAEVDKNAHFSQLRAIAVLTDAFTQRNRELVKALDPGGLAEDFHRGSLGIVREMIRAHKTWDFFRDKLELRHSPSHKEPLWVADTIAWDCHRPVLDTCVVHGLLDGARLREPPLVYCTAEYSPATWVRGSRPNDGRAYHLGEARLPIPVIEIPWDHLGSGWEYLALHHEVGHDIEADLGLRPALVESIATTLAQRGVPQGRIDTWKAWEGEVFADLCALRLAGPAFADALAGLLMLPEGNVRAYDDNDPHPTPYVRILLNAAYVRRLGDAPALQQHAAAIEHRWRSLYGATSGDPTLDALEQDFGIVCDAVMHTKLETLKDRSVADLIEYSAADDAKIRAAERFFRTGMNTPAGLRARHAPSAARLAVDSLAKANEATPQALAEVHGRILEVVKTAAPPGLRGGGPDVHEKFIASFADRMFRS